MGSYGFGDFPIDVQKALFTLVELGKTNLNMENHMGQENQIAKMSDLTQSILYKLRINKLDKTSRTLQNSAIIDTKGFLTIEGAQVFLDYLWQADKTAQETIAAEIAKMNKEDKKNASK